ncbi:MAG: exopolyphosphatase / guanosine-5'-triphosphate,3'-diphosphate pyrophosphatase [bacterium]|nr:MAG: exopolyphosphatase / guanosine-5'-triphosphate,3'-diphosphate pyrophosphatase [bacterium]
MAVLDVGGGSTELIRGDGTRARASMSLPVGALMITDRFFDADPPGAAAFRKADSILAVELVPLSPPDSGLEGRERLRAVGGSACAVAAWIHGFRRFDADRVHGLRVTRDALVAAALELADLTIQQRVDRGCAGHGRSRLLPGGAAILAASLRAMERDEFETSVFGLRHGRALLSFQSHL